MLVPTIMLVDQQASSLEQDVGVAVGRYSAGRPVPDRAARIVVSTPAPGSLGKARNAVQLIPI